MNRRSQLAIAIATTLVVAVGATIAHAQDKYTLKSPGGIALADFKGYEDWAVISSARTDEVLKVIVGNPTIIKAFKEGVPGNGRPFPDGSKMAKLQWKETKSKEAPFAVDVPDTFSQNFVMEKDSKRFPNSGGWGYAVFNYDPKTDKFTPDAASPADCGHACHTVVKAKDYVFHPYQKR
jgi:cytochrome P460